MVFCFWLRITLKGNRRQIRSLTVGNAQRSPDSREAQEAAECLLRAQLFYKDVIGAPQEKKIEGNAPCERCASSGANV